MTVLAIDQGTTSTRGIVLDDTGVAAVTEHLEHRQYYPASGWVEHDSEELLANICRCVDSCPQATVIGIDNQGESCLAWDAETKRAICPVIVWQDRRTAGIIEQLQVEGYESVTLELAGLPLDPYFSASKLAWIFRHVPEAIRLHKKGRLRCGTTDAFFLDRLTGHFVTDITTASRTSLMNIHTGQWDEQLCDVFGVPIEVLPQIVPTTGDFGVLSWHGRKIPVTASVVDQQAALYGHGCRRMGEAKITFGTGAFVLSVTGPRPLQATDKGLLPTVAWQFSGASPVYALDGGVYAAGAAINWARSLGLFRDFSDINGFTGQTAVERGLCFVPALSGLGCPYWDRSAAGLWIGLSLETTSRDLVQSILEGIALRAAEVVAAMDNILGASNRLSIDGGLSVNPYFCRFLADVCDRQVCVQQSSEQTALGTALLASQACGRTLPSYEPDVCFFEPQTVRSHLLDRYREAVEKSRGWYVDGCITPS
ncbi:FGGY family carbohydrate kinase [Desulfogranum japonicum]|uniref:FGGY family carbohydrate kinase n=1 Tax=Desulfogranum japonicum TaxID=231447 RepID=UPI0004291589|nr:FGGY family carbohydrate kinase [Desulfogranum japonicum]